ncbi:MAG: outer membrane lipoprotein chaperone LolA [Gammaproteobacteria bacterium]|nr:outer membrane lipoprotein chaperone LolA [Gammaproteobacteria bacterium]
MLLGRWKLYFFLCLTLITQTALSADLSQLLNSVTSMQANFTQTVYDNRGKAVQQSSGRMAFQRPGKFRWEVTKPIPQLIIANQTRLWIYDPDLAQVTIRSLQRAAGEAPALLLSHAEGLQQAFVVKASSSQANSQWFTLKPKKSDSFALIQMGFSNGRINEMRLKDNLDHTTRIHFSTIRSNINLPSSLFTFKPPSNVDVIDETHQR